MTLWDAVTEKLPESLWYGEALLATRHAACAIDALFRVYHYNWQYYAMLRLGETRPRRARTTSAVIYHRTGSTRWTMARRRSRCPRACCAHQARPALLAETGG